MQDDWTTKIGDIVRDTYANQGYTDVVIAIGALSANGDIHTQIWYPLGTATDFDIRLMWFAINNHLYNEYNEIQNGK